MITNLGEKRSYLIIVSLANLQNTVNLATKVLSSPVYGCYSQKRSLKDTVTSNEKLDVLKYERP